MPKQVWRLWGTNYSSHGSRVNLGFLFEDPPNNTDNHVRGDLRKARKEYVEFNGSWTFGDDLLLALPNYDGRDNAAG